MIFAFCVLAIAIIMLARNNIILGYRLRALSIASKLAKEDITKGKHWSHRYDALAKFGSYSGMLLDISRWRYRAFYPEHGDT